MRKPVKLFTLFFLLSLLASCGQQGQSISGRFTTKSDFFPTRKKQQPTNVAVPQTATQTSSQYTGSTYSQPSPAPQCTAGQNKVSLLYQTCSPIIFDNDDIVPPGCVQAISNLSYVDCSSINSKVQQALGACGAVFQQYSSYLPANCKQAIQSLGG